LMTRQAISPRFAIRIFLNMLFLLASLWAGSSLPIWHGRTEVTIPSYRKTARRQWFM
jgi:hypothetical protein